MDHKSKSGHNNHVSGVQHASYVDCVTQGVVLQHTKNPHRSQQQKRPIGTTITRSTITTLYSIINKRIACSSCEDATSP